MALSIDLRPEPLKKETAPYAVRKINLTFQFGPGSYGEGPGEGTQIAIKGLRVSVHVEFANVPVTGMAQISVYGLTLDHMNELSKAGLVFEARENYVLVEAGDDISGMTTVFNGEIVEAYPNMRMPDSSFYIHAFSANVIKLKPVEPTSFPGPTEAVTALEQIAKKAGLTIENNGVKAMLASPYFPGTAWTQLMSCIRAANCFGYIDGINNKLAVWPKDSSRSGNKVVISPENGMIGYPRFQRLQIIVRTLFTTKIQSGVGQVIKVDSQLSAADGEFTVISIAHDLMSEMPDGPWESTILATPVETKK